jgi:hypothetical protein
MYQIEKSLINGTITLSDSWSISATGSSAAPVLSAPGDEFVFSYIELTDVANFKTFKYDYLGKTENRYVETFYRLSRNGTTFTQWLPLHSYINDFPPISSLDLLYIDLKFVRKGTSTIGTIKLLDYRLSGTVERRMVEDGTTISVDETNNSFIVKPPYIYKVFKITDVEIITNGEIGVDFTIKYRFSQDYGRTVTQWEHLTKENISTARITPIRFFQIEYLIEFGTSNTNVLWNVNNLTYNLSNVNWGNVFEVVASPSKIWDINLIGDFQNVSKDYFKTNLYGVRDNCNCIKLGLVGGGIPAMSSGDEDSGKPETMSVLPELTEEQKTKLFEPYKLENANKLLEKMSNDSNTMFGHEVTYFLTDPDKKGIDYTFHEYQLYNFVANCNIKVSVEGNQFPENNGAINQFDLSLFDSFEIHIPKKIFKEAFGADKRPSKEDFLWFCEINKMFNVEHAHAYRGFNNYSIYYKVMLKKYRQTANIIGVNQDITDKLKNLTRNSTIDELFGTENKEDKAAVANKAQHQPLTREPIRLDIAAQIVKELVDNAEIIISKTHYDLSSVDFGVTYSYTAVSYKNMKDYFAQGTNVSYMCWFNINNYTINDYYNLFNYYDANNELGLNIEINNDAVSVLWNDYIYQMPLQDGLEEETWYAYLVNIDQRQRKITQWIYKRNVDDEIDAPFLVSTKLRKVYKNEEEMIPVEFKLEGINAKILSGDMKITNIRLFTEIVPEDQHTKILNQAIIRDDAKHLIFADNANQRLTLPNYPIGQVGPDNIYPIGQIGPDNI